MIREYDRVKIKTSGIVGEVIDIYQTGNGKTMYTVESEKKGAVGGRVNSPEWELFRCEEKELERLHE